MASENNILKKWLDKLQEESWNLELIISGFSIFGLFKAKAFLNTKSLLFDANDYLDDSLMAWIMILFMIVYAFVIISIVFLLIHVFLRGLWIGAIGIRYVSGEIDYNKLNYNTSVTNYLKRKLGNFDNYILKLEKASSLIFGYTFLLILVLFSVFLYFLFIWAIINISHRLLINTSISRITGWVISSLAIVFAAVIVVDFFTGGLFKKIKNKLFSRCYIFCNKVITWITLSFLWKPLYFNLIDRDKTKWLIYFVIPIVLLLLTVAPDTYNAYSIFPNNFDSERTATFKSIGFKEKARHSFQSMFYDNLRKKNEVIRVMSLQNNKIDSKSMELFVRLTNKDESTILRMDSTIKHVAIKGFSTHFIKMGEYENELEQRKKKASNKGISYYKQEQELYRANLAKILSSAKKLYAIKINDSRIDKDSMDIMFHKHTNQNEEGFLLFFYAKNVKNGMNLLTIEKLVYDERKNVYDTLDFSIPFIYIEH